MSLSISDCQIIGCQNRMKNAYAEHFKKRGGKSHQCDVYCTKGANKLHEEWHDQYLVSKAKEILCGAEI